MQTVIPIVAIVCAIACVIAFLVLTLKVMPAARQRADATAKRLTDSNKDLKNASAQQLTDILKATASLTDSMVKTAPAFWAMVGAVAFLLIAGLASGAIGGGPEKAAETNAASTNETESNNIPPSENTAANTANVAQNAAAQ